MTPPGADGGPAPDLALTAIGSRREVRLNAPGARTLLICFGQETQAGIEAVEGVARQRFPEASDLLVAHVVDLHKVPSLLRKIAEGVLESEHKKAVLALPEGRSPDDYAVILPDWNGSAVRALGLTDATQALGLVLIDAAGRVQWRYQGPEPATALETLLAQG